MKYPIKVAIFLVLATIAVVLIEREEGRNSLQALNQGYLDWLVGNASGKIEDPAVTFLRVDKDELDEHNLDPRLDWAIILKGLEEFEPKAVGIVPALDWEGDDVLAKGALKKRVNLMPRMVLGSILGPAAGEGGEDPAISKFASFQNVSGDQSALPTAKKVIALPDEDLLSNGDPAFTHIDLSEQPESSPNGIRVPLLAKLGDKVVPSFVLASILAYEGVTTDDVQVNLGRNIRIANHYKIPIDKGGYFTVYHGMRGIYPNINSTSLTLAVSQFEDLTQELRESSQATLDTLKTNTIVIGYDQETEHRFELPTGSKISLAELQAMAIATVQSGRHITHWPLVGRILSFIALTAVGAFMLKGSRFRGIIGGLLALLLYAIISLLTFQTSLSWTPPVAAIAVCIVLTILGVILPRSSTSNPTS
tara:strand:- start:4043 stop:5305 length:1263 start_codon:yes stop_codon:yes gene_type:complete